MLDNKIDLLQYIDMENVKLKDLIYDYLEESYNDIKEATLNDSSIINVITKYNNMLINIKNVCINRNKF